MLWPLWPLSYPAPLDHKHQIKRSGRLGHGGQGQGCSHGKQSTVLTDARKGAEAPAGTVVYDTFNSNNPLRLNRATQIS